jgi:hypothetical protein
MSWIHGVGRAAAGLVWIGWASAGLRAQELGVRTAAEAGGDAVHLFSSKLSLARIGLGLQPLASTEAYLVLGDGGSTWGATPSVGLRYLGEAGYTQVEVGWAFRDELAVAFFGGSRSGFHTTVQGERWGELYDAAGSASYNWGGDYFRGQARLSHRVSELAEGGSVGVGAEVIYQAETRDPSTAVERARAIQLGPVLQWTPAAARPTFFFSGGWKRSEAGLARRSSAYLRAEVSLR